MSLSCKMGAVKYWILGEGPLETQMAEAEDSSECIN
jgi:hypothetical protein